MKALKNVNTDGKLVKPRQLAEECNTSYNTIIRTAKDAGALFHIGRSVFVDTEIFYQYLDENCKVKD